MPKKLSLRDLHLFTLQLAVMLEAGLSLSQCLEVLCRMGSSTDAVARALLDYVDSGCLLSVAMSRTRLFGVAYLRMIRAGEATGQLEGVIRPLADHLEQSLHNRQGLVAALAYPAFVMAASAGMVGFLLYFQLPQMLKLTTQSGGEVPVLTRAIMYLVQPALPLGLLALALALMLGMRWAWRTPEGRRWVRGAVFATPVFGKIFYHLALARITRDIHLMWRHGVDLMTTLRTVGETPTHCPALDTALGGVAVRVEGGQTLGEALQAEKAFPKMLTLLVRAGEETGDVVVGLEHFTRTVEEDVHGRIRDMTSLLEPMMLLAMGLLVGVIVLASLLPVYNLIAKM